VRYFVYGGLVEEKKLLEVLRMDEVEMRDAVVFGGKIKLWDERKILVDAHSKEVVKGKMIVVQSMEMEYNLRGYIGE
jgi:hypothetical protein